MANDTTSEQVLTEYLERVHMLFEQAKEWTRQYDPDASFEEETVTIKEEPVEPYSARVLVIKRAGRKPIRLIPRGCWIIGAEGRVDMKSDLGSETFVYVLDGGPGIRFTVQTEGGHILDQGEPQPLFRDAREGWAFLHDRKLGMLPILDAELFCRLLEMLG